MLGAEELHSKLSENPLKASSFRWIRSLANSQDYWQFE
jgi:hypothetical protein